MSGRHSSPAGRRPRLAALPDLVGQAARLAPRQLNDELALAKYELKSRGVQAGIGAALFVVALIFLGLLVIALVVAAILGLATVMPGWLAALVVGAACLIILLIAVLIGLSRVKKAMPLIPADAIRGMRHDLGVITEGRNFDPRVLDPSTIQYKRAKAAKEAAEAKAKMDKAAEDRAHGRLKPPTPSEAELRERLAKRREHILDVRDGLVEELDVKRQAEGLAEDAAHAFNRVRAAAFAKAQSATRAAGAGSPRTGAGTTAGSTTAGGGPRASSAAASSDAGPNASAVGDAVKERWAPIAAFAVSATAFVVFLRKLVKS
ncbi:phage holin family protein [Sinomonas sp. JGH33]|uniref:Phage holin family protein n=1 Tax=Sinomonas terricola TaxID=3110330 RepID=A0ABU5T4P7_9MICC|nr:phage holin family protein [Sinomonas sp. JGH33]MEA5454637.1 phage holin family protein [Sinomonas sp. JGH33]